jgi:hypothetical protein
MKVFGRFLIAVLLWAVAIYVILVTIAMLSSESEPAAHYVQWLARALGLAAYPAGLAIAPTVFEDARPWRQAGFAFAGALVVSIVVLALLAVVAPAIGDDARSLTQLLQQMEATSESWETRNDAAWRFYTAFTSAFNALLFAAIGVQVGIWATYSVPASLRRGLFWVVGLGLLISGFGIWDTTYETFVLHTNADASMAACYTVLIPLSICAGLGLPTLTLLRRAGFPRNTS